jgi:hypothetical protein
MVALYAATSDAGMSSDFSLGSITFVGWSSTGSTMSRNSQAWSARVACKSFLGIYEHLFVAQRYHRVHLRRAAGGDSKGHKRHKQHQENAPRVDERVGGADVEQ